ncbi:extracellular matrix regulator RemB [Pectinatus sottacetonis]|uniref:extracellular matrix regulator RemB n=1 Tax=Pectinatus sottacetonis TaxID=1002795 RepID=UPI0018C4F1C7|nr:extracellular matrix/biofilm biosynthesis regulator RemA family protein [Pectinatus sottacetonis]
MFLHIGCNITIPLKNIIAIYNIKDKQDDEFILAMREKKKIVDVSKSLPKSCIVTVDKIYLSAISVITLQSRACDNYLNGVV